MRYYAFSEYLRDKYGVRVHRLSLDGGFTCPNRDGALGRDGCIYCNEKGFSPFAGMDLSLEEQIEKSIIFARERFNAEKFIAYFQNATGTYAPAGKLKQVYDSIKAFPDIVGLFISTRPDCVDGEKLDLIKSYADKYEVWIEYGLQTVHDKTLDLINRGHTFEQSAEAINETAKRGIKTGVHVILGLPGESNKEMTETAKKISKLPIWGIKLHVLHVLKDTELENMYKQGKVTLLTQDEYVKNVCDFLECLRPECIVFRLVSGAKKEFLIAPEWINNKSFIKKQIENELEARGTFQGSSFM